VHHRATARRAPLDLLALGGCWALAGVVCDVPFLSNAVLGLGFFLIGSTLLVAAMRRVSYLGWHVAILIVAGGLFVLALTPGNTLLGALLARRGQLDVWGRALALACGAVAVIGMSYLWLGGHARDVGRQTAYPLYLDGVTRVVALVIGPVAHLIRRVWSYLD
jgi:hypothetical protein